MSACIIGWSHSRFGKLPEETVESLVTKVARGALADAGLDAADIDEIIVGHFNGGLSNQDFSASLPMEIDPVLRFKTASRVENACATGSTAILHAGRAIASGAARHVLVVGVEKMTHLSSAEVGPILLKALHEPEQANAGNMGFGGVFARVARSYFQAYGDQSDAIARIAAKNHANGSRNPLAHVQKDLGYEFCRFESDKNPMIEAPLKRTDCSMITDGAAAVVMTDEETARASGKAIRIRASNLVSDRLPVAPRDLLAFEGPRNAWQKTLGDAGVTLGDLDFVETHDCFTIAELLEYEAMGLTPQGCGARAILEGWTERDGKLPVNPSGGLKAKGHPIGATGVSMHVLSAMQLTGDAGAMQLDRPELAGVFNMGGMAVANYCAILEPLK
ncbi:MAG: acetyl-CoA acetyltransferase [Pseudomonadota bacterium]